MKVEIISYTPNPELLIEEAARICYDSFEKKKPGSYVSIIEHLIRSGHESVFEHASVTYRVGGVSRALTHQLVRHRLASYSQRSQRYVKESEPNYVTPPSLKGKDFYLPGTRGEYEDAEEMYHLMMKKIWEFYNDLLKAGIKGEDARFILPNACCSEIIMTMNFRELRHFFKLRTSKHAQWEIRDMAKIMWNQATNIAQSVFADIKFEE